MDAPQTQSPRFQPAPPSRAHPAATIIKSLFLGVLTTLYIYWIWFSDPFIVQVLGMYALIWIVLPLLVIAFPLLLFAARRRRPLRPPLVRLLSVLVCTLLVSGAIPLNSLIQQRAAVLAKEYPGLVAPSLEEYRKAHGSYPASLSQLQSAPPVPRLLRRFGYHSTGQAYTFIFAEPGGLIDSWHYSSETGQWHLST